jgi:flagellar hook protein FlgE
MGNSMSVLGDNVSNVNTLAFKASRSTFQDVLSQSVSTAAGSAQVGRGVTLSTVDGIFAQGSFESTTNPTDLAIGGQGFFMLRAGDSAEAGMYTRAGEFRFDQEGYLTSPMGYFVQGWSVDSYTGERQGTIGDIYLGKSSPPVATQRVQAIVNLDSRVAANGDGISLFDAWNGTNIAAIPPSPPIDSANYSYTSAMKVYDAMGASHDITVYFSRTQVDNQWQFLVACDPSEDVRALSPGDDNYDPLGGARVDYQNHEGAGALMYGMINFSTKGDITAISAWNVPSDGDVGDLADPFNPFRVSLDPTQRHYSFATNFTGDENNNPIELNLGAQYSGGGTSDAFSPQALASTQYANASTTIYQDQNGYASGFLQSVSVDTDGVITGHFSNGQVLKKGQVALASFNNLAGLKKEGGNIFTQTTDSGAPVTGAPGTNGLGSIAPNSLEQSNVDLGNEFVKLITTQRGFQANSKIITTTDEMLADLINIKR